MTAREKAARAIAARMHGYPTYADEIDYELADAALSAALVIEPEDEEAAGIAMAKACGIENPKYKMGWPKLARAALEAFVARKTGK